MLLSTHQSKLAELYGIFKLRFIAVLLSTAVCGLPTLARAQTINYSGPIVITAGGTYTGNYQSLTSGVPCVRIATSAAVVLDGCALAGAGNLIEAGEGTNLTVRNCRGQGLTPTVDNQAPGRFIDIYRPQSLIIEHNVFTGTSGMVVNRWSGSGQPGSTLLVRYNQARNIDGRWRNAAGSTRSSFLLLNTVQHLPGVDIAYNEVLNTPDQSLVEDNLNLYNSSGTAQSPLHVHDNFVRGAYPFPATATGFTGTGMTTDGDGSTLAEASGYIEADHNQFVSTGNAAMNLAAGHDIYYHDNRAVTSGSLPDGRRFNAGWAGLGVFNYYQSNNVFFNNRVENNTVGYVSWGANAPYPDRQDLSPNACAPCTGTISLPNPITPATEEAELTLWQQKLQQAGVTVGPTLTPERAPVLAAGTIINPGFEFDQAPTWVPTGWQTWLGPLSDSDADYTEAFPGAHTGTYHGTHYRPSDYEVFTYQTINNLPTGNYTLRAWVSSTGGQPQAEMQAKNYGGAPLSATIGATYGGWALVEIKNIAVSYGKCQIGFYSRANGGQWLYFDDVEFVPQADAAQVSTVADLSAKPVLYPNPASDQVAVTMSFTQATPLAVTLTDLQGNQVASYERQATVGDNTFTLSTTDLPDGLYMLQLTSNEASSVQRLEIRH